MPTIEGKYTPEDWQNPDFSKTHKCHDWRNYVSEDVAALWPTFTDEQKQALARCFEEQAERENWD